MEGAGGGTLGAVSALWSTSACKPPVPNLKLTLESFRAVRGDRCPVATISCRSPHSSQCLCPLSLLWYRDETALSAIKLPLSTEENSWGRGWGSLLDSTVQYDLDPCSRGVARTGIGGLL